jgi:hypothetical protein
LQNNIIDQNFVTDFESLFSLKFDFALFQEYISMKGIKMFQMNKQMISLFLLLLQTMLLSLNHLDIIQHQIIQYNHHNFLNIELI